MSKKTAITAMALVSALNVGAVATAYAEGANEMSSKAEMQALTEAKLSASDAAAAALASTPGKIAEINFDTGENGIAYQVTVISSDGMEIELSVDANTGAVTKIAASEEAKGENEDKGNNADSESNDGGGNGEN